jgi:transmembrane sensor
VVTSAALVASAPVGARDSVRLPDGTRVILGPASVLTVPADYATNRRVELQGEGYFDVHHDAAHPFSVHAMNALITDIGTAFAVRSDPDDGVAVSVQEGVVRVGVDGRTGGAELRAGDAGTVGASGGVTARRGSATRDDIAWTTGKLMFREATMARVRDDLRRWYGVTLVVGDRTLAARRLTANFQRENRAQMLDVLTLALGARKLVHGDTVVLSGLR